MSDNSVYYQQDNNENLAITKITVQFIGSPKEYWKIYMINLALTILTLGLYRPWAKIRQYKYLYNHLLVDGIPMNFTAKPIRLLIGQLIVMIFLGLYAYSQITVNVTLTLILAFTFILILPILIWLSYRFFFRYTQWSGVSMAFTASKSEFYLETIIRFFISLLFITVPLAQRRWFRFIAKNAFWGSKRLSVDPPLEKLYTGLGLYLAMIMSGFFLFFVTFFILIGAMSVVTSGENLSDAEAGSIIGFVILGMLIYIVFVFGGMAFLKGYTVHALYHGLKIGEAKLRLNIKPLKLSWEYIKLYILTLLSFGIAYPYLFTKLLATIANNSHLELPEGETLITREMAQEGVSAVGIEALDDAGFDIDFDIGL